MAVLHDNDEAALSMVMITHTALSMVMVIRKYVIKVEREQSRFENIARTQWCEI